tara:strand:+ start:3002 stop:3190 length:189 start_codon:yes stop_codon:yes gene_type:complete
MTLAHYTARAKDMDIASLLYAIKDVTETLQAFRDRETNDPYVAKLYAEFDAYTVEVYKRRRG